MNRQEPTCDINAELEVHDLAQEFPTICRKWDENTCHNVAELIGCQGLPRAEMEAYGHRIVACWNACRGIPTERLLLAAELIDEQEWPVSSLEDDVCRRDFIANIQRRLLTCSPDANS